MKKTIIAILLLVNTACGAEQFTEAFADADIVNTIMEQGEIRKHATSSYQVETGLDTIEYLQVVQFDPTGSHQSCVVVIDPHLNQSVSCYMKLSYIDRALAYIATLFE